MLQLSVQNKFHANQVALQKSNLQLDDKSLEERVVLLILRDLIRLNWKVSFKPENVFITPPEYYDKETIKASMAIKRKEIIDINKKWIEKHISLGRNNLISGEEALNFKIIPEIEVVETQKQFDLFRILRFYWSSPFSDYVGRRIKLIVRNAAHPNRPVIGLIALGSPIIHIPERDNWIGWNVKTRTENLNYTMDAYIIGALPPYNHLLGGKLMAYILASKEVREIYENKYKGHISATSGKKLDKLVGVFTTSLFGRSSQYNRLTFDGRLLYQPIGETKGYGTLHLTKETFSAMQDFLKSKGIIISNRFGDGPIWTMRLINKAGELLNFDPHFLLRHSFKRKIYYIPLASNCSDFLNNKTDDIEYYNYSLDSLVGYWKERWLNNRIKNMDVIDEMLKFTPQNFFIL